MITVLRVASDLTFDSGSAHHLGFENNSLFAIYFSRLGSAQNQGPLHSR